MQRSESSGAGRSNDNVLLNDRPLSLRDLLEQLISIRAECKATFVYEADECSRTLKTITPRHFHAKLCQAAERPIGRLD